MKFLQFVLKSSVDDPTATNATNALAHICPYSVYMVLCNGTWTHYGVGDKTSLIFKSTKRISLLKLVKRYFVVNASCVETVVPADPNRALSMVEPTTSVVRSLIPTKDTELIFERTLNAKSFFAKLNEFYLMVDGKCLNHVWEDREGGKEFTKLLNDVSDWHKTSSNASASNVTLESTEPVISYYLRPVSNPMKMALDGACTSDAHIEHLRELIHLVAPVAPATHQMMDAHVQSVADDPPDIFEFLQDDNGKMFSDISLHTDGSYTNTFTSPTKPTMEHHMSPMGQMEHHMSPMGQMEHHMSPMDRWSII